MYLKLAEVDVGVVFDGGEELPFFKANVIPKKAGQGGEMGRGAFARVLDERANLLMLVNRAVREARVACGSQQGEQMAFLACEVLRKATVVVLFDTRPRGGDSASARICCRLQRVHREDQGLVVVTRECM